VVVGVVDVVVVDVVTSHPKILVAVALITLLALTPGGGIEDVAVAAVMAAEAVVDVAAMTEVEVDALVGVETKVVEVIETAMEIALKETGILWIPTSS
jgi:hypothetical protein